MKLPSEVFADPPHVRDEAAPCFACGRTWNQLYGDLLHKPDCIYWRWMNLPDLDEDDPIPAESRQWLTDALDFFNAHPELLEDT